MKNKLKRNKIIIGMSSAFLCSTALALGLVFGLPKDISKVDDIIVIKLNSSKYEYYKSIDNIVNKSLLVNRLSDLISETHKIKLKYNDLWTKFKETDLDHFYEKDHKIIDIYSYSFKEKSKYKYNFATDQCGSTKTYRDEGDCYNREHLVPQSFFKKQSPMVADIHHIFPTDGWVNNKRSSYDIANVKHTKWTALNGSKLGKDKNNETVFEPIDEFKGNIARAYFYFAIRYKNLIETKWRFFNPKYPFIEKRLETYLEWHEKDVIDVYDIHRNDNIFKIQKNRNPFVDIPELAKLIWNGNFANSKIKLIDIGND